MTEEEKDILQDKVLFEEANEKEMQQHKKLMRSESNYRTEYVLKQGVRRAAAKEFLKAALEEPADVDSQYDRMANYDMAEPAAARDEIITGTGIDKRIWISMAAVLLLALLSTFFLADFRTANDYVTAELKDLPVSSSELFGPDNSIARDAEMDWRTAIDSGDYEAIIEQIHPVDPIRKFALGISKFHLERQLPSDWLETVRRALSRTGEHDPIEGIWQLNVVRTHYLDSLQIRRELYEHRSDWAIVKDSGNAFLVLDIGQGASDDTSFNAHFSRIENQQRFYKYRCQFINPDWVVEATAHLVADDTLKYAYDVDSIYFQDKEGYNYKNQRLNWSFTWVKLRNRLPDFGQNEFQEILNSNYEDHGLNQLQVRWYYSLALYLSGDCEQANLALTELIDNQDSEYYRKAKKLRRKLKIECDLD